MFMFFQFFLLSKMSRNFRGSLGSKDKESGKEEEPPRVQIRGGCKKNFKDANSKILEYERCDGHYCVRCAVCHNV